MLDSWLVKIGVKGQEVVLSEMDKIRKKGDDLSKKKLAVNLAAKTTEKKVKPKAAELAKKPSAKGKAEELAKPKAEKEKKEKTAEEKAKSKTADKENKNTTKFGKSVDKFGNTTATLARSASSLDPASVIHSGLSELAKIAVAGIPFAIAGAALATATGTIGMAKSTTAAQYGLKKRDVTAGYYGEKISFAKEMPEAEKNRISELNKTIGKYAKEKQTASMQKETLQLVAGQVLTKKNPKAAEDEKAYQKKISKAQTEKYGIQEKYTSKWSNEEMAMLRTSVGQAYGKIQQPLADAINQFTLSNKYDPNALARVAAGNWRSTGTDQGWILQQITDSLGDVPPTIAQKLQASLLKRYGVTEIQKTTEEQKEAQTINAAWANRNEQQISQIFDAIAASANELLGLNNKLNELQVKMVSAGTGVATALNFVANQIKDMTHKVKTGN
ncbi:MAG: hypothetical protein PHN88_15960 [Ignavibacteria bacterium]|nr:hypothetical protein [Ignavibacteria bacterium]